MKGEGDGDEGSGERSTEVQTGTRPVLIVVLVRNCTKSRPIPNNNISYMKNTLIDFRRLGGVCSI